MANEVITGVEGAVTYTPSGGSSTVVKITNFTITDKGGVIDTTDSSTSGYREKVPFKFKDWSGTMDLFLRAGDSEIPVNTVCAGVFTVETSDATITRTGNFIPTELSEPVPIEAEEAVKQSVTFEGSGALTKVNT